LSEGSVSDSNRGLDSISTLLWLCRHGFGSNNGFRLGVLTEFHGFDSN